VNLGLPVELEEIVNLNSDETRETVTVSGVCRRSCVGPLAPQETTSNLLPHASSLDGVVVDRRR